MTKRTRDSTPHHSSASQRRAEAMHLQRVEGNPFDAADLALLEMFDRKGWSLEERRAYITVMLKERRIPHAAE